MESALSFISVDNDFLFLFFVLLAFLWLKNTDFKYEQILRFLLKWRRKKKLPCWYIATILSLRQFHFVMVFFFFFKQNEINVWWSIFGPVDHFLTLTRRKNKSTIINETAKITIFIRSKSYYCWFFPHHFPLYWSIFLILISFLSKLPVGITFLFIFYKLFCFFRSDIESESANKQQFRWNLFYFT